MTSEKRHVHEHGQDHILWRPGRLMGFHTAKSEAKIPRR
jgi:hypothetical protein